MTCCVVEMREQHCRSETTAPSAKAMNEISEELSSMFFQFFCQQLHEIKWCNSPYPLPLASANLLLAITDGSKALNRQEVDEQSCKCSPSNAAQPACNH